MFQKLNTNNTVVETSQCKAEINQCNTPVEIGKCNEKCSSG